MKNYLILPVLTPILFSAAGAHAEVTLDGSLGPAAALPGPDYQIGAEVGQQHGGNLFHSFQDFNLQSHESATFSGPDNVQNVISRVTGGNPSSIDGTLRSTIPNADMYLLNPYGILFGPNAKLDLQGGFHVSTADYLRLQDGGRFEARYPNNSLLTVAPVAAFGFLTDTPAAIKTQDSQLSVPKGKTFSWIGGGLEFKGNIPPDYDINSEILTSHGSSWLLADSGRLNLASVASRGEVIPTAEGLDLTATTTGGPILATNTELGVSDEEGGGNIFIRGGRFEMTRSLINGQTVNQAGGVTDIQVANLTLKDRTVIETNTFGTGPGGHLNLQVTGELNQTGSSIFANSHGTMPQAGNAGNVKVQARQVNLAEGAQIASTTFGTGQGGTVHLEVAETLTATGGNAEGYSSGVFADSDNEELAKAGNAGDVIIQARTLNLFDGAQIASATFGTGQGGAVHLQVADTLTVSGEDFEGYHSGVFVSSINNQLEKAGSAGNLEIEARQIIVRQGGVISSSTYGTGQGGTLHLQAEILTVSGQDTRGYPSAIAAASINNEEDRVGGDWITEGLQPGEAGSLYIQANTINLTERGKISTQTNNAGGGDITLLSPNLLYLQNGQITTSVKGGKSNGGNITIDRPQFLVLDKGQIKAQADAGHGGNIRISAQQFLKTPDSLISASSRVGLDGQVIIDSPAETISGSLLVLGTTFTDVSSLLPGFCTELSFEEFINRSSFTFNPIVGSSPRPDDLKPSSLLLPIQSSPNVTKATGSKEKKAELTQRLAWLTGCHR